MSASPAPKPIRLPTKLLTLLGAGNFIVGMGAFVVVGVITPVAAAFGISKADAGWMLTVYALVYAFSSPVLVAITGAHDRQRILMAGLVIFFCGSAVSALAPNFPALLIGRAIMAVGGGLVTPVSASIAVALVPPESRGKALAIVFGGLTLAQVFGVPAGAWLGYAFGWPSAFAAVCILTIIGIVGVGFMVPAHIIVPKTSLATLGSILVTPRLITAVAFTAFFVAGLYTVYTYLAPLLEARLGLGRDGITAILLIFGLGAVVGNSLGGLMTDRFGPQKTMLVLCVAQLILMPMITFVPFTLYLMAGVIAVWSIFAWSFNVPQQIRLANLDGPRTPVLLALNAAAIYLGGSLGSLVGGQVLLRANMDWLGLVGAAFAVLAMITLIRAEKFRTAVIS
jgi:MFS transporter, DHA1 family, inner membrane transport protein